MKKSKILLSVLFCLVFLSSLIFFGACGERDDEGATWRSGLFTTISLSLTAEEGKISACARNDFTLGFSTVPVYVYLYSSEYESSARENMDLEAEEYTKDLDIFHELRATVPVGTTRKYWLARMRYKMIDGWHEVSTSVVMI